MVPAHSESVQVQGAGDQGGCGTFGSSSRSSPSAGYESSANVCWEKGVRWTVAVGWLHFLLGGRQLVEGTGVWCLEGQRFLVGCRGHSSRMQTRWKGFQSDHDLVTTDSKEVRMSVCPPFPVMVLFFASLF